MIYPTALLLMSGASASSGAWKMLNHGAGSPVRCGAEGKLQCASDDGSSCKWGTYGSHADYAEVPSVTASNPLETSCPGWVPYDNKDACAELGCYPQTSGTVTCTLNGDQVTVSTPCNDPTVAYHCEASNGNCVCSTDNVYGENCKSITAASTFLPIGGTCDNSNGYYNPTSWNLAMNIDPSDNHNMGWSAEWDDNVDVGSASTSLTNDYISKQVYDTPTQFIAIVRHNEGTCEAVKTWRLNTKQSLYQYFKDENPGRVIATSGGAEYDDRRVTIESNDPIFGGTGNGDLAFNWHYSNNGARIALDNGYVHGALPGTGTNSDDLHGLGNEFGATTSNGEGSSAWWHDASVLQGDCHGGSCTTQGTDHGTNLATGTKLGSYAIYVTDSDSITSGPPCTASGLSNSI